MRWEPIAAVIRAADEQALLAFAAGFLSICATVLSAFDVARSEASDGDEP
jgi:hypothetical protein